MIGLHHGHYHLPRLSGIRGIFWAHSVRGIAENLVIIFVPIYLFQLGYSITAILGYLAYEGAVWLMLIYPAMKLMARLGPERTMAVSLLGNIAQFLLLLTLPIFHWPLPLIAAVWAIYVSLYWPAMRAAFASNLAHRRAGRYVGVWSALTTFAAGAAPALGGVVAVLAGINAIYFLAIGLFVTSSLPLLSRRRTGLTIPRTFRPSDLRRHGNDQLANFSETFCSAAETQVWPLLVFFLVPTYAGVGLLSSVVVLTSIGIALYVGRREEVKGERRYLRRGVAATGLGGLGRLAVQNGGQVIGVNLVSGIGYALYLTPFNTAYYERIERFGLSYLFVMQFASAVAWATIFLLLTVLSMLVTDPRTVLLAGVVLAIPLSLGIYRIKA